MATLLISPDMQDEHNSTAHLLDNDPIIFLDCTGMEIGALAVGGLAVGIVLGIVAALLFGTFIAFIPFPIFGLALGVFRGGKKLGKAKEGLPGGYISRLISIGLCKLNLSQQFIVRVGYWGIRR